MIGLVVHGTRGDDDAPSITHTENRNPSPHPPAKPRCLVQLHPELEGDEPVPPPVQDEKGARHAGDAVEGRVAFVDEAAGAGGACHGAADEGEEAEGEGAGVVERGRGEAGEGGVEDDACVVWCVVCLCVYGACTSG